MAIQRMTTDVEFIQKLSTFPNQDDGLTAEELKARFDAGAVAIKRYINDTLIPGIEGGGYGGSGTDEGEDEENDNSGTAGGYYLPSVKDNGDGTATFGFSASSADLPAVDEVTVALPKGEKGDSGKDGVYTGDSAGIQQYLYDLRDAGITVARFEGSYTISEKTYIPAGMTIQGGVFTSDGPVWMFSALGDNVRLVNVTMKADSMDRLPDIYETNGYDGAGTCSNVVGFFSDGHEGVGLIHCVCEGITPAKINNGSGLIHGCTVVDTPMFVWGTNVKLTASDNDVSICDTGLDKYYHVYYVDENSELTAQRNRIRCNTTVAFRTVYHPMTGGNDGTYRAKVVVDGDIVVGNFQQIIECHYADVLLKNCYIRNTNPDAWQEMGTTACSSFRYEKCVLDYAGAEGQEFDKSMISGRDIPDGVAPGIWKGSGYSTCYVVYHGCKIYRTNTLPKRATFQNCDIELVPASGSSLANLCNVIGCCMTIQGKTSQKEEDGVLVTELVSAPSCLGVIASSDARFDFIGNQVRFVHPNTNNYLLRYKSLDGVVANNVFSGVKAETKLWYGDTNLGISQNNVLKEVTA